MTGSLRGGVDAADDVRRGGDVHLVSISQDSRQIHCRCVGFGRWPTCLSKCIHGARTRSEHVDARTSYSADHMHGHRCRCPLVDGHCWYRTDTPITDGCADPRPRKCGLKGWSRHPQNEHEDDCPCRYSCCSTNEPRHPDPRDPPSGFEKPATQLVLQLMHIADVYAALLLRRVVRTGEL